MDLVEVLGFLFMLSTMDLGRVTRVVVHHHLRWQVELFCRNTRLKIWVPLKKLCLKTSVIMVWFGNEEYAPLQNLYTSFLTVLFSLIRGVSARLDLAQLWLLPCHRFPRLSAQTLGLRKGLLFSKQIIEYMPTQVCVVFQRPTIINSYWWDTRQPLANRRFESFRVTQIPLSKSDCWHDYKG